ncbi:hypothetical protein SAMN05216503_1649 [Polaribacter sp. KT25b]|uniref:hypothetical protein n=1 Tax=Polaribacter sp. KT25b TaxID=1855336 RepID=UPI00087A3102|nr:hypothetical protein [Polaribacter sp. KT25b]SDS00066.1 hypothetical protein SAMN05216503_1649 [Polaribacter sp. KT25b]
MKSIKKTILLFTLLTLYNCSELNSALSNVNRGMGGKCRVYIAENYLYDSSSDKWLSGKYYTKDRDGNDIDYKEDSWISSCGKYYANKGVFSTYYRTSPYSNGKYKFVVSCSSWY